MHKFKKVFFCLSVIFNFNLLADGLGADACINAMKIGQKIVDKSLPIIERTVQDGSANLGYKAAEKAADGLVEAASRFGVDMAKVCAPVAMIGVAVYGVFKIWDVSKDLGRWTYSYFVPSKTDVVRNQEAAERIDFLNARNEFKKCLLKNMQNKKCGLDLPCGCEDLASKMAIIAGSDEEVNRLTQVVGKFGKN